MLKHMQKEELDHLFISYIENIMKFLTYSKIAKEYTNKTVGKSPKRYVSTSAGSTVRFPGFWFYYA